jgi:hypothetical protein
MILRVSHLTKCIMCAINAYMSEDVVKSYQQLLSSFEGRIVPKEEIVEFLLGYEAWLTETSERVLH